MEFKNVTHNFGWNFDIDYGVGLGLRNLSVMIHNKTLNSSENKCKPPSSSSISSSGSRRILNNFLDRGDKKSLNYLRMLPSGSSSRSKPPDRNSGGSSKYKYPKSPLLSPTQPRSGFYFEPGPSIL